MTDQSRAAFEEHFKLSSRQAKKDNAGEYIDALVRARCEGWQAGFNVAVAIFLDGYEAQQRRIARGSPNGIGAQIHMQRTISVIDDMRRVVPISNNDR